VIPKIIHYCWFGRNPLPELAQKCIASWRKYMPDYEIWQWVENVDGNVNDNGNEFCDKVMVFDVEMIPYTTEAYRQKKYAFVSDYARFWILYKYGGIYFDTDVEVIRPLDEIIAQGNFMGVESDYCKEGDFVTVAPGLGLGVTPNHEVIKKMMDYYKGLEFVFNPDGKDQMTIVYVATDVLRRLGLKDMAGIQRVEDVYIYPSEYFCPINITTKRLHITPNTCTIHHYAATWMDKKFSLKNFVKKYMPEDLIVLVSEMKRKIKK